jgi:hypothetical protein
MNLANYKISIDSSSFIKPNEKATYETQVKEHLKWIYRTRVGIVLFNAIKFHGKPITISPYTGGICNAEGGGHTFSGIVRYSPSTFSSRNAACAKQRADGGRGLLFDEILFHELFHAFRAVSGKFNQNAVSWQLYNYTDSEEFFAVLITNIYVADKSNKIKSGVRAGHSNFKSLGEDYQKPWGFFSRGSQVFPLVKQLYDENRGLFVQVGNVSDTPFNPLGDFLADRDKAEKASKAADKGVPLANIMVEMIKNL